MTRSLFPLLAAALAAGCLPQTSAPVGDSAEPLDPGATDSIPDDDALNSSMECGATSFVHSPLSATDPSTGRFYANRSTAAPSDHLGDDLEATPGTPVTAGVTGILRYIGGATFYGEVAAVEVTFCPPILVEAADGSIVEVDTALFIFGHLDVNSDLRVGDCVGPDTLLGVIAPDETNGHGLPHVHHAVRLQSASEAIATDGRYWLKGYGGSSDYPMFALPSALVDAHAEVPSWAGSAFDRLYADGITADRASGYAGRLKWNRAETAHLLSQALDLPSVETWGRCTSPYIDVDGSDWFAQQVTALSWLERGDETVPFNRPADQLFHPTCGLTRAELLKVLFEAWGVPERGSAWVPFSDADEIPSGLLTYVERAAFYGIISTDNATFRPNEVATPAETAVMLDAMLDAFGQATPVADDFSDDPSSQCQEGGW